MAHNRVKRTATEFREQAEKLGIRHMNIRPCDLCGKWVGYDFIDGEVFFNGACGCADFFGLRQRSWEDVARLYSMQDDPGTMAALDEFWGFSPRLEG